ncbi:MAG: hypothetical protein QF492_03625 [Candidatus Krumholzibacteria bacterium]|nr:hypothetical protein [Candidatus Krumholzibacteria bacterium]MDP6668988.1 hypothetical protein [Candidatus Krumholzibacteria bacterium]MDP6797525.1 hypothetical protein [Candidatus Krumholzibacteria bacterium]MDP7021372.1 hypothetical protein [Candidatus Krumholzibacteria bacterium]
MAHAYTPGLKVLRHSTVRKTRILPLKGEVYAGLGSEVQPSDVVAATELPGNVQMVNVAGQLNIEAEDVPECMLKTEGDSIEIGELLARSKGIFGLFKSNLKSPTTGTVESISLITGQVVLREAPMPVQVDAYIQGRITKLIPEEGVEVETEAAFLQGIFGVGGERQGEILVAVEDPAEELSVDRIREEHAGKILVGGSFLSLEAMKKAMEIGVAGIIVGGFNYRDLRPILGYDLGVAITGSENIPTTLVVTEGYGNIAMAGRSFRLLQERAGEIASINGATQIRAGVIRPEVIIPLSGTSSDDSRKAAEVTGIEEGSLVRVIRAPWFGALGRVKGLPPELTEMESGTLCRVAEISLDEGGDVMIPRANLEMLETD